jgi:hypothetical protein
MNRPSSILRAPRTLILLLDQNNAELIANTGEHVRGLCVYSFKASEEFESRRSKEPYGLLSSSFHILSKFGGVKR